MDREIKFKLWVKDNGQGMSEMLNMEDINPEYFYDMLINPKKHNVIWLEFTGLKDKNEKEIYEGDILLKGNIKYIQNHHSPQVGMGSTW